MAEAAVHHLSTPEGVALPLRVARAGDRIAAFLIDFAIIVGGTVAVVLLLVLASGSQVPGSLALSLALLAIFFLRSFFFITCETRWNGLTPGKRALGIRVISRSGGALTTGAVFARNFARELELFLPLAILFAPEALLPGSPGWAQLLGSVWIFIFALLPLMSRHRLRCGDLLAGTLVVKTPKAILLDDLAAAPAGQAGGKAADETIRFTRQQLDIYGIRELQVLEGVLRRYDDGSLDPLVLGEVAAKIRRKIGWPTEDRTPSGPFLRAFYRAQRHRLEHKLLFGHRQQRKRS